jgi:hypothetical protein
MIFFGGFVPTRQTIPDLRYLRFIIDCLGRWPPPFCLAKTKLRGFEIQDGKFFVMFSDVVLRVEYIVS